MVQHILKIIWKERKINSWILLELILIFCVLWFCVDYMYFIASQRLPPNGFDIEHTYRLHMGMKEEGSEIISSGTYEERNTLLENIWHIFDRIKRHPDIEAASISFGAIPYSSSNWGVGVYIDSVTTNTKIKEVTSGFFDVFKIKIIESNISKWENSSEKKKAIISGDCKDYFLEKPITSIHTFNRGRVGDMPSADIITEVAGVAGKTKIDDYNEYRPILYFPLKKSNTDLAVNIDQAEFVVRVKTEADKDFPGKFRKEMQSQLSIDPYYLSSIQSMNDRKKEYMKEHEYDNNFKSISSVFTFLIINIFLAVIGTFWFRTQSRRGEIGLRQALGSSRRKVRLLYITETVLLLFLSSIVAIIICVNLATANILEEIDLPVVYREDQTINIGQYLINYAITFLIIAIIAIAAVWYPAKKASSTYPSEALRDE